MYIYLIRCNVERLTLYSTLCYHYAQCSIVHIVQWARAQLRSAFQRFYYPAQNATMALRAHRTGKVQRYILF